MLGELKQDLLHNNLTNANFQDMTFMLCNQTMKQHVISTDGTTNLVQPDKTGFSF